MSHSPPAAPQTGAWLSAEDCAHFCRSPGDSRWVKEVHERMGLAIVLGAWDAFAKACQDWPGALIHNTKEAQGKLLLDKILLKDGPECFAAGKAWGEALGAHPESSAMFQSDLARVASERASAPNDAMRVALLAFCSGAISSGPDRKILHEGMWAAFVDSPTARGGMTVPEARLFGSAWAQAAKQGRPGEAEGWCSRALATAVQHWAYGRRDDALCFLRVATEADVDASPGWLGVAWREKIEPMIAARLRDAAVDRRPGEPFPSKSWAAALEAETAEGLSEFLAKVSPRHLAQATLPGSNPLPRALAESAQLGMAANATQGAPKSKPPRV